jgi:fibronectin-binding autotransporter adhesin
MTSFGARPVLLTADKAVALDIADAANTFTFNTALTQGLGAFVKRGPGTLILTQNNTYTGTTTVSAGTLIINGNQTLANGAVSIAANATLGGTGTIGGSTTISANGKLAFNISTAAGSHDKLELASGKTLTFSGVSTLTISSASGASIGDYVLLTAPGGITGSAPATLNLPAGWAATVTKENSNQDLVLHVTTVGVSGYAAWKGANAGGQNPDLDFDNDGVENGVEYFMNAAAGFTANPALNSSNTITWPNGGNIPASAYGTQFVIQTSSDLSTWADVAAGSLTANTNGPGGSLTYTLTGASPRFVRLKVTPN